MQILKVKKDIDDLTVFLRFWDLPTLKFCVNMLMKLTPGDSKDEEDWQPRSADIPGFNVTNIYYTVYSPNGIAVQLLQNTFVWFTSSIFWLYFTPFYSRLLPIFSVANQGGNSQNFLGKFVRFFITLRCFNGVVIHKN